jgi:hypothetical protein
MTTRHLVPIVGGVELIITSWNSIHLHNLLVAQQLNKLPALYGTPIYAIVFTSNLTQLITPQTYIWEVFSLNLGRDIDPSIILTQIFASFLGPFR